MNELITIKKDPSQWQNPQFIVLVLHNDDLNQVSWEMRTEDANPVWPVSQDVESVDYAGSAELLGFTGIRVKSDHEIEAAWDTAFANPGITLIDAFTSKDVAPLPPHITRELAVNAAKGLLREGSAGIGPVRDAAEAMVAEGVDRIKGAFHFGNNQRE